MEPLGILWNCFLAAVPVWLAPSAHKKWTWAVLWLLFLPNTTYLLTTWRHYVAFEEPWMVAMRVAVHVLYSGFGVVCFVLAVRPLEDRIGRWLPLLCWLTALGVYLGLVVRLNSWDALLRPWSVAVAIGHAMASPSIMAAVCLFALAHWAGYVAVRRAAVCRFNRVTG